MQWTVEHGAHMPWESYTQERGFLQIWLRQSIRAEVELWGWIGGGEEGIWVKWYEGKMNKGFFNSCAH